MTTQESTEDALRLWVLSEINLLYSSSCMGSLYSHGIKLRAEPSMLMVHRTTGIACSITG